MKARAATIEDISEMVEMQIAMMDEAGPKLHKRAHRADAVREYLVNLLDTTTAFVFVLEDDSRLVGTIVASLNLTSPFFDSFWQVSGLYVRPRYRKSRAVFKLVEAVLAVADRLNIKGAILTAEGPNTLEHYCQRHGLLPYSTIFSGQFR